MCSVQHPGRGCWRWWNQVGEILNNLKSVVTDGDAGNATEVLAHDVVFLRLIVRQNSLLAHVKQLISCCRASSVYAVRASSTNSSPLISTLCTLVFPQIHARLPSLLVQRYTQSSNRLKAYDTSKEEMLKSVGASMYPCFTSFLIGKGSEEEPSYWTVPCMPS